MMDQETARHSHDVGAWAALCKRVAELETEVETWHQQAEESRRSCQTLRTLLDSIPQRVFWKDRNSTYVGCNRLFARDAGLDDSGKVTGLVGISRDITEQRRAEAEREELIRQLQKAAADVKTLSGLVPICANCKKIRDDKGFWTQIEAYIQDRTPAHFSHGICPECASKLYPDYHPKQKS